MNDLTALANACVIALDDESLALDGMRILLNALLPSSAHLTTFQLAAEALTYANTHQVDVAFVDISLRDGDGVDVARQLMATNPSINIIFTTGYSSYTQIALQMHVSGYIMKPVSPSKLREELQHLRYPIPEKTVQRLRVQCFGNFDVFSTDGSRLFFPRTKAKELFAYMVYMQGTSISVREATAVLFEDKPYDNKLQNYMQQIISTMMATLEEVDARDVVTRTRGQLALNRALITCDYFDLLNGVPSAIESFSGSFMGQYSWAEATSGFLQTHDPSAYPELIRTMNGGIPDEA